MKKTALYIHPLSAGPRSKRQSRPVNHVGTTNTSSSSSPPPNNLYPLLLCAPTMSNDSFTTQGTRFDVCPFTWLPVEFVSFSGSQFTWPSGISGIERVACCSNGDLQRMLRCARTPVQPLVVLMPTQFDLFQCLFQSPHQYSTYLG